jgi:hypothetical protein
MESMAFVRSRPLQSRRIGHVGLFGEAPRDDRVCLGGSRAGLQCLESSCEPVTHWRRFGGMVISPLIHRIVRQLEPADELVW